MKILCKLGLHRWRWQWVGENGWGTGWYSRECVRCKKRRGLA